MTWYKSPFKSAEMNDENGFDPSLSLSLLSSLPTFLISLLFSPRRSSFVSSSRRKQKRRKERRKSVVLRDTKFRSDPFRSMEDSAQGLFENEKERERERRGARRPEPALRRIAD